MQRMRTLSALSVMTTGLLVFGLHGSTVRAALIHPDDKTTFPDLSAGFVSGTAKYTAATGEFQVQNVPFGLALGMGANDSYDVTSTDGGLRLQNLNVQVDQNGMMVPGSTSSFELTGKVTIGTQTFSGTLLKGSVYAGVGSVDLGSSVAGASMFDLDLKIDKDASLLGQAFSGGYAYLRLAIERGSTFDGGFTKDFAGYKVASNLRAYPGIPPAPVPEPTTLVVLVAAGAGLLYRRRRRISKGDLDASLVD